MSDASITVPEAPAKRTDDAWVYRYGWRETIRQQPDGRIDWVQEPLTAEDFLHPREGDRFMFTPVHGQAMRYLIGVLEVVVNGEEGAVVLSDTRIDFQQGGVKPMGPDVLLVRDCRGPVNLAEGTFHVADHHARADLVIEVTSPATRDTDLDAKVIRYHKAGVRHYVIADHRPLGDELGFCLLGYRWTPDGYLRLPQDDPRCLWVEPARMWIEAHGDDLRCLDEARVPIPSVREAVREIRQERARNEEIQAMADEAILARQESDRKAEAAEERIRLLEAELAKRGTPPA